MAIGPGSLQSRGRGTQVDYSNFSVGRGQGRGRGLGHGSVLGVVPPVVTMAATVFETNPFAMDINPATTNGLKLYQSATAKRDDSDKLHLSIPKATKFIEAMKADSDKFSWGKLTSTISVNGTDSSSTSKKSLALSDNLKAAMMTKFRCSESDAAKLWSDVVSQSN